VTALLIGLGFRARSGKDTAAAEILKRRGLQNVYHSEGGPCERYNIEIIPFAKPLKQEINAMAARAGGMRELFSVLPFSVPSWVVYDENADMSDPSCPLGKQRALLQFYGTEVKRAADKDYWIRQHAYAVSSSSAEIILVPDMRFENEMEYIRENGETVRVDRDGLPPATHASETALADTSDEDWSIILENNGTLEEFLEGATTCFDELLTNFPQQFATRALVAKDSN